MNNSAWTDVNKGYIIIKWCRYQDPLLFVSVRCLAANQQVVADTSKYMVPFGLTDIFVSVAR